MVAAPQRVEFVANSQKPTKAENGIGYPAASLLEDQPFDLSDVISLDVIDVGADNHVAGDKIMGLTAMEQKRVRYLDVPGNLLQASR